MANLVVIIFCGIWHIGHAKFSLGQAVEKTAAAAETDGEAAEAVACIHALTGAPGNKLQEILDHPDVGKYWESFEACAFVNKSLKNWNHCGGTVTKLVDKFSWPVCRKIDLCPRDAGLDAFHGVCYRQCENHLVEGKIKTKCARSLLEAAGLTSSRVCADSLPRSAVLHYMGAWDMMGTSLSSVCSAIFTSVAAFISPNPNISWNDLAGGLFHSWVLLLIICYAVSALGAANGACRFAVLCAPFQFAPFFFSYNQLAQLFFNNMTVIFDSRSGVLEDVPEDTEDTKEDDTEKEAWWKTYTKVGCSGVGIWLPFILLSGATLIFLIPMFVASFWSFIAYIHIVVLIFLAYMCAGGMVFGIFVGFEEYQKKPGGDGGEGDNEEAKGEEKDSTFDDEQEKDKKNDGEEGDNEEAKGDKVNDGGDGDNEEAKSEEQEKDKKHVGEEGYNEEAKGDKVNDGGEGDHEPKKMGAKLVLGAIVTTQMIPFLTLVMVSGFLLYFTGDWKPLHDGFFNDLGFPKFNWPRFSFFDNPEYFFKVLGQLFTFNVNIQMEDLFSLSLFVQAALTISKIGMAIFTKWRKSRNPQNETKAKDDAGKENTTEEHNSDDERKLEESA